MKKQLLSSLTYIFLLPFLFQSCNDQEAPHIPAPRLTIEEEANVTGRTSAIVSGIISRQADTEIAECGFLYSTVSSIPEEEAGVYLLNPAANGTQSAQLTDLLPNTTYYYCLYANSGYMNIRSETHQFTTDADGAPAFSEITYSDVTDYTVTLSCRLLDNGGYDISTIGYCYKRIEDGDYSLPTERDLVVNLNPSSTTLNTTLENLVPESEYIVRAFGINKGYNGTGYSEPITVTTSEELSPVLSTIEALATTELSVTVKSSVTDPKGRTIKEYGFCWSSENQVPTTALTHQSCEVGQDGTFQYTIENLNPNTTYYIRAYAINDQDQVGYSTTYTFLTQGGVTVTTGDASSITDETANVSGTVDAVNYGIIRAKGILYSKNADPTAEGNSRTEDWINQGSTVSVTLSDLEIGVTYYYCTFAETTANAIVYGDIKSFTTTITKPVLDIPYMQDVLDKTATAQSTVTNRVELGHYGYEISTNALPEGQFGSGTQIVYGEGYSGWQFTGYLTDLQPNTTYYLRAWAERGKGNQNTTTIDPATANMNYYTFSEAITFTTTGEIDTPTLTGLQVIEINKNSIRLEMTITGNGNYPIQEAGFCCTTDPNKLPTREDYEESNYYYPGEDTHVETTLNNLTPNTTYYIRGYAYNGYETGYSDPITVTTMGNTPGIDDNPSPDIE